MRALIRPRPAFRPADHRRGVTLVEMLVVVALVVLMMTILVQIFQTATGAMSLSRTTQELDVTLRQLDSIIRTDLGGATAKMTPPNDPRDERGYLEYIENAPADAQGEDTDDMLGLTTKAPEGQVFTGRQYLVGTTSNPINPAIQPTAITSQLAEVIYFLRNGNLYRRVFLVAPDRQASIDASVGPPQLGGGYTTTMFGPTINVSWQGLNDISCHPVPAASAASGFKVIANTLGHLSDRQNRSFHLRFCNDYVGSNGPSDGIPDDNNFDGVPDYYSTLYTSGTANGTAPNIQVHEAVPYTGVQRVSVTSRDVFAFPYVYPGMYSVPDPSRISHSPNLGWVHSLLPATVNGQPVINHAPLDLNQDNLASPTAGQTWWGYPTWRETMTGFGSNSTGWTDPIIYLPNHSNHQPNGLNPFDPTVAPSAQSPNFLPPLAITSLQGAPPFNDGAGSASFVAYPPAPTRIYEEDLILTNVRSFDIKAYDKNAALYNTSVNGLYSAGYFDLGYGAASYVGGPNGTGVTSQTAVAWQGVNAEPIGYGHEGRMPPLLTDFRLHPRKYYNVGDSSNGVSRMVRTFDTWSTDYTNAPDTDIFLNQYPANVPAIYPSFPAPYPTGLRGLQIQIRVADPRNTKVKVLTITHDFTDKL